ncbi:MAG: hypothetical protein C7B45_13060 [Sulfobacillus acidophilus]|uniref:Uncharacterized protein n=1 Tax=Sulfobacillus acidophilus TaxID=53633 RepID=A0A2T2WF67_9FIRM|nr:MAG: hypothetical protein C7B45_13060 [Sulfobacillus acidophilus]
MQLDAKRRIQERVRDRLLHVAGIGGVQRWAVQVRRTRCENLVAGISPIAVALWYEEVRQNPG